MLKLLIHTLESPVNRIKAPGQLVKSLIDHSKVLADLIKALCKFRIPVASVAKGRVGGIALFVNETRQVGKGKKWGLYYYFCSDGAFLKSRSSAFVSCSSLFSTTTSGSMPSLSIFFPSGVT